MKPGVAEQLEEAGIGAIVYKSLFEEQVQLEGLQMSEDLSEYEYRNAEMERLFPSIEHAGPKEHLFNLEKLKKSVNIPVIASLNAIYEPTWIEYAKELEKTGVDGLELNLYTVPGYFEMEGNAVEAKQVQIIEAVKKAVNILPPSDKPPIVSGLLYSIISTMAAPLISKTELILKTRRVCKLILARYFKILANSRITVKPRPPIIKRIMIVPFTR